MGSLRLRNDEKSWTHAITTSRGDDMSLLTVVLTLLVIGVLLWLVTNYVPIDPTIKRIIVAVVVICVVIWLLQVFGVLGYINTPVPKIR